MKTRVEKVIRWEQGDLTAEDLVAVLVYVLNKGYRLTDAITVGGHSELTFEGVEQR